MKAAIMQPYFLPYIGYFQLIAAVDVFIIYDNIKYTKKGWINRNRMLRNGTDALFSLPVKADSDHRDVFERRLATDFNRDKLLNEFMEAYRRAPCFDQTFPLLQDILWFENVNLFQFLRHSILKVCEHLQLTTEIRVSSNINIDHDLKGQDKVMAICEAIGADCYVNAIGGMKLYSKDSFRERGIDLKFISTLPFQYEQFGHEFVPWLSIIDVMMFNPANRIQNKLFNNFKLI